MWWIIDLFIGLFFFFLQSGPFGDCLPLGCTECVPLNVSLTLYVCHVHVGARLLQGGMHVEQVGHEGQVELAVPVGDVVGGDKLPAVQPRRLLQHQLGPLGQVLLLRAHRGEEGG